MSSEASGVSGQPMRVRLRQSAIGCGINVWSKHLWLGPSGPVRALSVSGHAALMGRLSCPYMHRLIPTWAICPFIAAALSKWTVLAGSPKEAITRWEAAWCDAMLEVLASPAPRLAANVSAYGLSCAASYGVREPRDSAESHPCARSYCTAIT